jgi:uncharacterized membrane protein
LTRRIEDLDYSAVQQSQSPQGSIPVSTDYPQEATPRSREPLMIGLLIVLVVAANALVVVESPLPWVNAVAGFLLAIGLPAWMLSQKIDWRTPAPSERLLYSVVSAIFGLIMAGLIANTILPHVGIARPLDRGPVLVTVDVWLGAIALWRPKKFSPVIPPLRLDKLQGADWIVGLLSALCIPLAVMGANRLNNGTGSGLTLTMLFIAAIALTVMFARRDTLNPGTITAAVYFIALSMLLMTSLRGWYITGSDIQNEYAVFELTKSHGDWNISNFQNAYNACLSITILPTMLSQLLRVDDPYIFKFWFQLLFALCPLFVYRISLRHAGRTIAIIATIYFVAFPTFFTDMPFVNRQEIAYLFVGACILAATDPAVDYKAGRLRIAVFSLGIVLTHYSTSYVFFGTLAIAWVVYKTLALIRRDRGAGSDRDAGTASVEPPVKRSRGRFTPNISIVNCVLLLAGIFLWNGVATHTAGDLTTVLSQAVQSLRGGSGDKSTDTSYSLVGGSGAQTPNQVLSAYWTSTLLEPNSQKVEPDSARVAAGLFSNKTLKAYPVTAVSQPNLPVTSLGNSIDSAGLNVATLNSLIRAGVARLLQLFIVIGLISAFLAWRKRPSRWMTQLIALSCGAIAIVALQVVVPVISTDYGVLRGFQQAMLVSGPLVAVGSYAIFRFLPGKWRARAVFFVAIVFFTSLVGAIPQTLGGYPAQLNLNNSGEYYDLYYTHPQDITAVQWFQSSIASKPLTSAVQMNSYTDNELLTFDNLNVNTNDFPTFLLKSSYLFYGYQTSTTGQSSIFVNGDLVTYNYPMGLVNSEYNRLYSSDGAMIYGPSS